MMTYKRHEAPSVVTKDAAGGSPNGDYCFKHSAPLCLPKKFQEFLYLVQNLLLAFDLHTGKLLPEQERVMSILWAEIDHLQKIEYERQQAERDFWGDVHYER